MSESFTPDSLIAGDFPIATEKVTIDTGTLVRGTVLGKITSTGKCVICDSAGTDDGRCSPFAVLLEDADASSADVEAAAALTGQFNEDALVFGGTDTKATHKVAMRALSMFQCAPVSA
jgi:hypothetical protein